MVYEQFDTDNAWSHNFGKSTDLHLAIHIMFAANDKIKSLVSS